MDRFSEKQSRIEQCRIEACAHYPEIWSNMIAEWKTPAPVDRVWLTYSANYLLRTNDIHWAIDPLTLHWIIKDAPKVGVARDLSTLSFVLLTHDHKDHLDIDLLSALRNFPITWVVPEFMLPKVVRQADLLPEKIIVPSPLEPLELHGIRLLPFEGLHWEWRPDGSIKQVPAMGYLIESKARYWLFPGDTRTYDAARLPKVDSVDDVFAHLWLGRGSALEDEAPLLDAFCRFFLDLGPRRLILTHLNEFGHDANDFWDETHVELIRSRIQGLSSDLEFDYALMGESALL